MVAVAYGLWKQPIDANIFGIQASIKGELRIPFACHVRYPTSTVPLDVSFHQFAQLPAELQLRVLQFCDKPTLFRLMQTSRSIRSEALKLFFADPETWYCVEGDWLEEGGHPTDGIHDIDFLRLIQRLCIESSSIGVSQWKDEHIRNFWKRVQYLFPLAKYVMLEDVYKNHSDGLESSSTASRPSQSEKRFCQLCPQNINIFLSILHGPLYGRLERSLWRRVSIQEDGNETQELDQCESYHPGPSIIVPHKPFRGRVGTLLSLHFNGWATTSEGLALEVFRNAAIERHHFHERHEPFGCPAPDCDAWFKQPEEYTTHLATLRSTHDKSYYVPEPYQSLFADAEKRLEQEDLRYVEMLESYVEWVGEERDSEQRKLARKKFLYELEQDALHVQEETLIFTRRWFDQMIPWDDLDVMKDYIQETKNRARLE